MKCVASWRRPDHVKPIDVDIARLGREPKLVLAELVGRAFRHGDDGDRVVGLSLEFVKLAAQDLLVAPDRSVHDGQIRGQAAPVVRTAAPATPAHAKCLSSFILLSSLGLVTAARCCIANLILTKMARPTPSGRLIGAASR